MTNLEWIKTLSAEELADWFYDEWLRRLQYRWSSSRGGLIIWLKDRKTENNSEKPNNCEDLQDWKDRMWAEAIVTEATISKMEQVDKDINVRSKDEPQSDCDTCLYKDAYDEWEGDCDDCRDASNYEPQTMLNDGTLVINVEDATMVGRVLVEDGKNLGGLYYPDEKDEPQTDCPYREYPCDVCGEQADCPWK